MRIEQVTFTRFIAAMAIVVFHFGRNKFPFDDSSVSFLFQYADIGVSYFFILSGFIMIIAYGNRPRVSQWEYFQNRFARIYPVYAFALILFVAVEVMLSHNVNVTDLTINLGLLQSWIPGKALTLNYPGWSLSVEFLFYAVFPILFNRLYLDRGKSLFAWVALFWLGSQLFLHIGYTTVFQDVPPFADRSFINYFPLMHLNQFMVGNLAGIYFLNHQEMRGTHDMKILALLASGVLLIRYQSDVILHNGLMAIIFVPIIVFMALNTGVITRLFRHRLAVFLGEISFGIYILQAPVFIFTHHLLIVILGLQLYSIHVFYISILILIAVSSVTYLAIEKPMRNVLRSRGTIG